MKKLVTALVVAAVGLTAMVSTPALLADGGKPTIAQTGKASGQNDPSKKDSTSDATSHKAQDTVSDLKAQLEKMRTERDSLKDQLNTATKDNGMLRDQLASAQADAKTKQDQMDQQIGQQTQQISDLNKSVGALQQQIRDAKANAAQWQLQANNLSQQLAQDEKGITYIYAAPQNRIVELRRLQALERNLLQLVARNGKSVDPNYQAIVSEHARIVALNKMLSDAYNARHQQWTCQQ